MTDVTTVLRRDHRTVEQLFEEYEASEDADVLDRICDELEVHTSIEEELVYPRLAELDPDLEGHAEQEHATTKDLIDQIRSGDPDANRLAQQLKVAVLHHVQEEEGKAFPLMESELGAELGTIGAEVEQRRHELRPESP